MPSYSPEQVELIVEHRLERLRDTWKGERAALLEERDALRTEVEELRTEVGELRRQALGTGTPLWDDA